MLQTKRNTQNAIRKTQYAKRNTQNAIRIAYHVSRITYHVLPCRGFTVIEMIVTLAILAVIVVIASGFLFTTISSSKKVEVTKEVRQNGSYALSVMEGLILTSRSVSCSDNKIIVLDQDGFSTTFNCSGGKISSNSAVLTGSNVTVSECDFSCTTDSGRPIKVNLDFIVSQTSSVTLRPSEKSTMHFQTEVVAKNYN